MSDEVSFHYFPGEILPILQKGVIEKVKDAAHGVKELFKGGYEAWVLGFFSIFGF